MPVGIWLDRYGPRRVEGVLLLFAAAGAMLFGLSKGFAALVLGHALIGLGVAAAFTGGLKAIVLWFPKDSVATMKWPPPAPPKPPFGLPNPDEDPLLKALGLIPLRPYPTKR